MKRSATATAVAISVAVLSACSSGDGATDASTQTSTTTESVATATESPTAPTPTTPATTASGPPPTPSVAGPGPDADVATTAFAVNLDRALAIAGRSVPGGVITKIELDFDRSSNAWVWKLDSQNNTAQSEITIDAQSGQVVGTEQDRESPNPVAVDPRILPPETAIQRATTLVPGSVASWDLEFDDGRQRYSIDIRNPGGSTTDVEVDVLSGIASET